jgi:hypothetical protein
MDILIPFGIGILFQQILKHPGVKHMTDNTQKDTKKSGIVSKLMGALKGKEGGCCCCGGTKIVPKKGEKKDE